MVRRSLVNHVLRVAFASCLLLLLQTGAAFAGNARLSWDPNVDTDTAGYMLVYGTSSRVYTASVTLPRATTTHEVSGLADGAYFFAVRAFDVNGVQSGNSNEVRVVVGTISTPPPEPSISSPIVSSLAPASGPTVGGTLVKVTGSDFLAGVIVLVGETEATITARTATSMTIRTPASDSEGAASLTVTNPDGGSMTMEAAFTYVDPIVPISAPTIGNVSPASGPTVGGTDVVITGTAFATGASASFGGVPATTLAATSTSLTVRTPASVVGVAAVSVLNPDGGIAIRTAGFTFIAPEVPTPGPTVTSFLPAAGPIAGGTSVTILGTNFKSGVVVRFGGVAGTVMSLTSTQLVVRTPAQKAALVALTVLNTDGNGVQLPNAFTYRGPAPTVVSVFPVRGPAGGSTDVTIDGAGFQTGATVTIDNQPALILSATANRIVVRVPAHAPAAVPVVVTNPDAQQVEKAAGYTYVNGGPAVAQVLPPVGPLRGGNSITLLGSGFLNSTVSIGGVGAAVLTRSGDMMTVRVPARGAGTVAIVVRNSDGLAVTAPVAYSYEDPNGAFTRYFAEGAAGSFFQTRFAVANPHDEAVPLTVTFTDTLGTATPMTLNVPARARVTIDESNRPVLGSEAFATKFEAPRVLGVERTVSWAAGGPIYGAHSDTGAAAPRTWWVLAEGATIGGFNTFYLLQNPTTTAAEVKVQYLLSTGQRIEKIHAVAPLSRTNIWVNKDDPALASAEMSATLTSMNGVPVVVERSMYRNNGGELFSAGHSSAAVDAPSMRWFLAEGATGGTFDEFVLIANPNAAAATLRVSYLRAGKAPIVKTYTARPQSRLTVWVDQEAPELASAEVSVVVESLTPTPVVVERSMWWKSAAGAGEWVEAHNSRGETTTAARWLVADGEAGGPGEASTFVLVANTGSTAARVMFTLLTETGATRTVEDTVTANGRYSLDVAGAFPEARGTRFSVLVEAVSATAALVVERSSYSSTPRTTWASGTNSLAMPLR